MGGQYPPTPEPQPVAKKSAPKPVAPEVARLRYLASLDARSLGEIAAAARMSQPQLNQTLSGHRANPSIGTFRSILAALGRKWADLDEDE